MEKLMKEFLNNPKVEEVRYDGDIDKFLNTYSQMEYMICARFHAIILSCLCKQKMFVMSYSKKIDNVINDLELNLPILHFHKTDRRHIISKEKLRFDLVDELYDNIVERVLSPTYEQNFTLCEDDDASTKKKNGVNTTSQVIAENTSNEHYSGSSNQKKSIEKIMSHYYIKNSSFNTKSFLDLKRDTNAMINSEQK